MWHAILAPVLAEALAADTPALAVARSFSGRRWRFTKADEQAVEALVRGQGLSRILARLLVSRGVPEGEVGDILAPTLRRLLPEPLGLHEMGKAVARTKAAIVAGESIAVLGDYDVDGSASSALLYDFLAQVAAPPRVYIPDRMTEGYGPSERALRTLKEEGASLVVTVDCGAGAHEALRAARDAGLDVIVLDHHRVESGPPCFAQVNPNQPADNSGLGHLAAAGVTLLFVVALNRALRDEGWYAGGRSEPDLMQALDLVALATVCDVVPLKGLNRAFVRGGLARLAALERPGLAALAAVAQASAPFTAYHLGFVLGPRINAGGRVGGARLGFELLTASDAETASELAKRLDVHNKERQALETLILDEAVVMAAHQDNAPFLLAANEGWHAGVVGIVAGRLKDRFGKPSFVAGFEGGLGRGSARSVAGIDIGALVRAAFEKGLIEAGGGHAMAAGFSLRSEQLEPLRDFLAREFAAKAGLIETASDVEIETLVSPAGATAALAAEFARIGPFGAGNAEPLIAVPDAQVVFADVVGKNHVRLRLAGADGARLDAIAFRKADEPLGKGLLASRGRRIHAAGWLRAEEWQGQVRVQLHLEDAAPAGA